MCIYVTDSKRFAWFLSVKRIIVFCCKNSEKYIRHERFELFIDHTQLVHQRLENNVIHEVLLNFKSTFNWSDFNKRLRNRRLCQLDLKLTSGFWNSSTKNSKKIHSDKAGMSCITLLYHFDWFHWLHWSVNETKLFTFICINLNSWRENCVHHFNRAEFIRFYQIEWTHQQFTIKSSERVWPLRVRA